MRVRKGFVSIIQLLNLRTYICSNKIIFLILAFVHKRRRQRGVKNWSKLPTDKGL